MPQKLPKGIIFDLGETVITGGLRDFRAGNAAMLALARDTNGVTPEDMAIKMAEYQDWLDKGRTGSRMEISFQSLQRLLFGLLGVRFEIDFFELEKAFWNHAAKYTFMPGIHKLLDSMEALNIRTGIISNSLFTGPVLRGELEKLGLADRFSFLIASNEYGARKPHPGLYQVALRQLELKADEVWFVGDMLEYDIRGALDSGMFPVWLNRHKQPRLFEDDYLEITALDELRMKILEME